jgi:hypothetical protein
MERQVGDDHPSGTNSFKNFRGEVQPRGGCGDRAALLRIDSLVTLTIHCLVVTANVWRQRDMPQKLQPGEEVVDRREAKKAFAKLTVRRDCGCKEFIPARACEGKLLAHRHPACRASQGSPFPVAHLLGEQHFHLPDVISHARSEQPCGNDAAVVQHQQVPRSQLFGQLVKLRVFPRPAFPVQDEHAAAAAFRRGFLRDKLRRKIEVEVGNQHSSDCMKARYPQSREGAHYGDNDPCSR